MPSRPCSSTNRARREPAGFTLVELMIAMVLLGLLTTSIYGVFANTSDSLSEAESLADTIDKARFALEYTRNDLQVASAQATPDSAGDPWVQPQTNRVRLIGMLPYTGWQDFRPAVPLFQTHNSAVSFDGIIVVGAIDYPRSFFITGVNSTLTNASIRSDERGLFRLVNVDPFNTQVGVPFAGFDLAQPDIQAMLNLPAYANRVLRVSDRQGFFQFAHITSASINGSNIALNLVAGQLMTKTSLAPWGMDPANESDVSYDAAMLDAYWYHVVADNADPSNFLLVRDRLSLPRLTAALPDNTVTGALDLSAINPEGLLAVPNERIVISDRVVDFQVWVDCGDAATGALTATTWANTWATPNGTGTCMQPSQARPKLARMAHMRLSLRTRNERGNRAHFRLPNTAPGFDSTQPTAQLQSFDMVPTARGAAAVVTLQTSVELTNFALRNLR